jgi:hypothetical protein
MTAMTLMEWALVGSIVISWIAVAAALYAMLRVRRQSALTEKLYRRLNHDLQVANSGSVGMGKRLLSVERSLQDTSRKQEVLVSKSQRQATNDLDDVPFSQASLLLNAGLAVEDVAKRCGLSRAEVSLMELMQMHKQSSVAA